LPGAGVTASWVRVLNPRTDFRSMAEAQRGARLSSLSLLLLLLSVVPSSLWMFANPNWMTDYMASVTAAQGASAEGLKVQAAFFEGVMPSLVIGGLFFNALLFGGVAFSQWKLATRTIPIILLAWLGYTLLMMPVRLAMPAELRPDLPAWISALSLVATVLCIGLNIAALRGAQAFHRLRQIP